MILLPTCVCVCARFVFLSLFPVCQSPVYTCDRSRCLPSLRISLCLCCVSVSCLDCPTCRPGLSPCLVPRVCVVFVCGVWYVSCGVFQTPLFSVSCMCCFSPHLPRRVVPPPQPATPTLSFLLIDCSGVKVTRLQESDYRSHSHPLRSASHSLTLSLSLSSPALPPSLSPCLPRLCVCVSATHGFLSLCPHNTTFSVAVWSSNRTEETGENSSARQYKRAHANKTGQ